RYPMSLKPCPECGRPVSELAASCPLCGRPVDSPTAKESAVGEQGATPESRLPAIGPSPGKSSHRRSAPAHQAFRLLRLVLTTVAAIVGGLILLAWYDRQKINAENAAY